VLNQVHPLVPPTRAARGPDGTRRFEALGGYPTRTQAEAALADALARRSHGITLDPAKLTVNQYLDRWLAHIQTTLRARTVARYRALLAHHVRPHIGPQPLKTLEPLQIQAIYDQLAVGGRRDGKPGGLAPQHILAVHRCLHRTLEQAVIWRLISRNAAKDATPPPRPQREAVALTPEQVAVLLDATDHTRSPWLGPWTVLAAATGARNGELCGLEWADLDLDAGTVRSTGPSPSSTPRSSPAPPATIMATPTAGARSWPSGQSSPRPTTPSSPCRPSPSRRCAITAVNNSGFA
jgi:integrase